MIPAILYYVAVFFAVHFEAKRAGLLGLPRAEIPRLGAVMRNRGHLFLPLVVILGGLIAGYSAPYCEAFAQAETREALAKGAFTVFLRCDLATVLRRVRIGGSRPLAVSRERIVSLFAEREPSYRLADWEVDATAPPEVVAREVVRAFREEGAAPVRTEG